MILVFKVFCRHSSIFILHVVYLAAEVVVSRQASLAERAASADLRTAMVGCSMSRLLFTANSQGIKMYAWRSLKANSSFYWDDYKFIYNIKARCQNSPPVNINGRSVDNLSYKSCLDIEGLKRYKLVEQF